MKAIIKNLLIAILLFGIFLLGIFYLIINTEMNYGHHFTFVNELNIKIDSLEIQIGEVKTIVYSEEDSIVDLESNLNVPENGYPHEVTFLIYSNKNVMSLKADSFNCYNCDGNHKYILQNTGAKYMFLN